MTIDDAGKHVVLEVLKFQHTMQ